MMSCYRNAAICDLTLISHGGFFVPTFQEATCNFAIHVYEKLSSTEGNVFFSPFSLSVALAMLLRGLKDEAANEIRQMLGYTDADLPPEQILYTFDWMFSTFEDTKECYVLNIANALVHRKGLELLPDYKNDLQRVYRASIWQTDFNEDSRNAVDRINKWVETKTRGTIPKILDFLQPSPVLVFLNAVYFKGLWENPFDLKKTRPKAFFNRGQHLKQVPTMTIRKTFPFAETENYKAVEMGYQGYDVYMLLLLPLERDGIHQLEESIDIDFLRSIRKSLRDKKVKISLPKFRLEYSNNMRDVFSDLGMTTIFDSRKSSFAGLGKNDVLEVSEIVHKAVLDLSEEGTEAAATSAIALNRLSLKRIPDFIADHPFLFLLYDKRSEIILFMGRVVEL